MIDRSHALPVRRQCTMLSLSRSTAYYDRKETSMADLALMRRMDELHLEYPFAGSRMLRDLLKGEGHRIGCKHVATLMKKIGIAVSRAKYFILCRESTDRNLIGLPESTVRQRIIGSAKSKFLAYYTKQGSLFG